MAKKHKRDYPQEIKHIKKNLSFVANHIKSPLVGLDIGGGDGVILDAMTQLNVLSHSYLVEPCLTSIWKDIYEYNFSLKNNFSKKRIIHMEIDGLDSKIPIMDSDSLMIKTYNPWIHWKELIKIHSPQYILTSTKEDPTYPILAKKYIQIDSDNHDMNIVLLKRKKL